MKTVDSKLREELKALTDTNYTDEELEHFCVSHNITRDEAADIAADWLIPKDCKGCMNISYYAGDRMSPTFRGYPCNACCRNKKDLYKFL